MKGKLKYLQVISLTKYIENSKMYSIMLSLVTCKLITCYLVHNGAKSLIKIKVSR